MPYFYIIEHKESGKRYAGCKTLKDCKPEELLAENGYHTSSTYIKDIIEKEGLEAFSIISLIEMDDPYTYETEFLREHDCANSDMWFNKHNNIRNAFGSVEYKKELMDKYGVDNAMKIPGVREKISKAVSKTRKDLGMAKGDKNPCYGLFGKDHPASGRRTEETIQKMKENCGKWEREEKHCKAISERQKKESSFVTNNPMNDPEKRKLVSESKIGKKKYKNIITGEYKMFKPGTEPDGYDKVKKE